MIALIATFCLLTSFRISIRPFSPIQEYMPQSPEMARQSARPVLLTSAGWKDIIECFTPLEPEKSLILPPGKMASIRLAFFDGRSWLYVDENGLANFGGRRGVFHVKRWLTVGPKLFPRKSPSFIGSITPVKLINATDLPVTLIDATGRMQGKIKPGESATLDCWWGGHVLWVHDSPVVSVSRFWSLDRVSGLTVPKELQGWKMRISEILVEEDSIQWVFGPSSSPIRVWAADLPVVEMTPGCKLANVLSKWTGG